LKIEGGPTVVAAADAPNYAQRLGIQKDQVVQELGWDDDVDDDIRADIEDACGGELLDEDSDDVVDVVLLWWRDDDGDLVDRLMDAITPLADDGVIWVLTPKTGHSGHVMPAEIAESAPLAVRSIRETMRGDLAARIKAATDREKQEQDWLRKTEDFGEGVRSTSERRPPQFKGS
jgi:enoyl-CoA hydratase/carnithine racemase